MTLVKSYISEYKSEEENLGSPPTVTKRSVCTLRPGFRGSLGY